MEQTVHTKNSEATQGIHLLAKPAGPACNLDCAYCFYLEKQALFGKGKSCRMGDDVLSAYIANYIAVQPTPVVSSRRPWGWEDSFPWMLQGYSNR